MKTITLFLKDKKIDLIESQEVELCEKYNVNNIYSPKLLTTEIIISEKQHTQIQKWALDTNFELPQSEEEIILDKQKIIFECYNKYDELIEIQVEEKIILDRKYNEIEKIEVVEKQVMDTFPSFNKHIEEIKNKITI